MGILSCTVSCWNQTSLLSPPQPVWDVGPDSIVSQLLLHLLLTRKQSLTSVHLCCNSFGDFHVDVYIELLSSIQLSRDPSKTYSFDPSCQLFDPEGEHSRTNNVNTGIYVLHYNTPQIPGMSSHYQTEVHPVGPQRGPSTKLLLLRFIPMLMAK